MWPRGKCAAEPGCVLRPKKALKVGMVELQVVPFSVGFWWVTSSSPRARVSPAVGSAFFPSRVAVEQGRHGFCSWAKKSEPQRGDCLSKCCVSPAKSAHLRVSIGVGVLCLPLVLWWAVFRQLPPTGLFSRYLPLTPLPHPLWCRSRLPDSICRLSVQSMALFNHAYNGGHDWPCWRLRPQAGWALRCSGRV